MSTLGDLQRRFQQRLLDGADAITVDLSAGGRLMGVYDHAYTARLIEILAGDFEAVHTLLGDAQFDVAMRGYLAAHPSRTPSVRWIGQHLPAWLSATDPWSSHPEVIAMAHLEWMLGLAFDAPDAPGVRDRDVQAVPPEAWPLLTFTLHPALQTADLTHDVVPFYRAVKAETEPDAVPPPYGAPVTWAAWRDPDSLNVRYRALEADEAAALRAIGAGQTFDQVCDVTAGIAGPDQAALRAATLLRHWIASGWIIGIDAEGLSW